jgi:hypothetical protein
MPDWIVVDVEIARTVEEAGGWDCTHKMGVAVAAVYSFRADRFTLYGPSDGTALRDRLLAADRVSGFNHASFDVPVIFGLPRAMLPSDIPAHLRGPLAKLQRNCDDLLERVWHALRGRHTGWKLGDVAKHTLGRTKIEDGADAPLLFQRGEFARLHNYVLDDVALERDLALFADKYQFLMGGLPPRCVRLPAWKAVSS